MPLPSVSDQPLPTLRRYKLLKKLLKGCQPHDEPSLEGQQCQQCEARFFEELSQQLAAANR